jgi:signal transduction histidine kinase
MKKILVVEDAQALRRDIIEMLGYEGYDVEGAENGLAGVERARAYHPDLIICDIMMPGMDGFGVLETLRSDPTTSTIPFIFLTARTERMDMRHGMELGADDYLTKPFTAAELITTVQTRLNKHVEVVKKAEDKMTALRSNMLLALPHELRTPLNVILGFSDLMMMDAQTMEPPRVGDIARYINNAAMRLYRMVENYLLYMQLELVAQKSDQRRILQEGICPNSRSTIEDQAQHWATHPHPPSEPRSQDLQLDLIDSGELAMAEEYFKKIIEELVDNACKFSDVGTPIRITSERKGDLLAFSVTDCGLGMSADQIAAVGAYMQFERRLYEQQGTGLGLAICKQLAELHGGTFTINSTPEQGTKVTVLLPLASD